MGLIERHVFFDSARAANVGAVVVKNAMAAEWGDDVLDAHRAVFDAILHSQQDTARNAARVHFEGAAKRLTDRADIKDI